MRIHLGGLGGPIPKRALLGPGDNVTAIPPQAFFLQAGVWPAVDYVGLGYTHFEVWCIGAAGGNGGGIVERVGGGLTPVQEFLHPGGRPGGGGLHHVKGLLADLPDLVDVVVGQTGSLGQNDNGVRPYLYVTDADDRILLPANFRLNPTWVPPVPGGDGGYSAFGDICRASGGKGGGAGKTTDPFMHYYLENDVDPSQTVFDIVYSRGGGDGGDGGVGDSIVAGGGAQGGRTIPQYPWAGLVNEIHRDLYVGSYAGERAQSGTWDGTVGEGGGGGVNDNTIDPSFNTGGKGSFSPTDTSVYGIAPPFSGGGARINKKQGFGAIGEGYNPNGAVYLRVYVDVV